MLADFLADLHPEIHSDPFAGTLTDRIASLHAAGVPVSALLAAVVADGPLPVELPAAALWWRLSRHINPAEHVVTAEPAPARWGAEFRARVGDAKAAELERSPWWPSLVDVVNHGLEAGVPLRDLLSVDGSVDGSPSGDLCLALLRRALQLTTAPPHPAGDPQAFDQPTTARLEQQAEERWRAWAGMTNPAWVKSEHWPAIANQLDRVDPAIVDFDRLAQKLHASPANLVVAILKDLNDPDQAVEPTRRPQSADSVLINANERHRRFSQHVNPTTAPRR